LLEFAAVGSMTFEKFLQAAMRQALATGLQRLVRGAAVALATLLTFVFFLILFPAFLICWAFVALRDHLRDWC
jgi:hypothetical protein